MFIAFYNGYPIYDGDTHAYLATGFTKVLLSDRPPFYGNFIRITSFWASLWYTIFFQCLILSYLLLRYIRLLNFGRPVFRYSLVSVITIVSFTAVSWVCSDLMPEIFAAILLLAILLYLFEDKQTIGRSVGYLLIVTLAIVVHNSHFLIVSLFACCILLCAIAKKHKQWIKKSMLLILISIGFYFYMCTQNFQSGHGFVFSPSAKLFTMAKLSSNGILKIYLNDSCKYKDLKLCPYKDQLPAYPWEFMWPPSFSPLVKFGNWDSSAAEFDGIIHDVFTNPKYLKMYAQKSFISTFRQLCEVQISMPTAETDPYKSVRFKTFFEDEFNDFSISKQTTNSIGTHDFNVIYNLFFILSSIFLLFFYHRFQDTALLRIYSCILIFFLVNAFVTSTFSTVHYRFQSRIFWILPATNAVLIIRYLKYKYSVTAPLTTVSPKPHF